MVACFAGPLAWIRHSPGLKGETRIEESSDAVAPSIAALEQRYHLRALLGEGSFGRIFQAQSKRQGFRCAVKVAAECDTDDREISLHGTFEHANIARFIESFSHAATVCIVMELCEGGELFDALQGQGVFSEDDARVGFQQIMNAVAHLHEHGVAHRDLKLENFLLKRRGVSLRENTLKLIDFGFATSFRPGAKSMRTRCGTPGFIAPEVVTDKAYDERCDVFSCGVILHCMLCGEMPFRESEATLGQLARPEGPIRFGSEEIRKTVSSKASWLIERLLRKCPARRPTSEKVLRDSWLALDS